VDNQYILIVQGKSIINGTVLRQKGCAVICRAVQIYILSSLL